jgi:hypothetical protein
LLAVAAVKNLEITQMDIKGAYLNGDLDEEIYMRQPEGYNDGTGRVCHLYKTLYGLRQSGRSWNRKFNKEVTDLGFRATQADPCVYIRQTDGNTQYITVWVDDLLIFTNSIDEGSQIKTELKGKFDVTDIGEPHLIIGIQIHRDRAQKQIAISQTNYIDTILTRYGMQSANPVSTPLDPNVLLEKRVKGEEADPRIKSGYQSMVGALMYAAIGTRPDIMYAVMRLSQYASNPGPDHWTAAKRVFRYLSGTRDLQLTYCANEYGEVIGAGYSDADYASNPDDRKSVSGYTYLIGGAAYCWSSKKQSTTAQSSTEAEYTAIAHAARQAIWSRYLFAELGYPEEEPTLLFGDNQSAIAIAHDPQYHARSKHFDVQNHFIREKIEQKIIELSYCPTDEMVADIFTKALPREKHERFVRELGLLPA